MIIDVKLNIEEVLSIPPNELEELFSSIIRSDRMGHHFLVVSRELCDWVIINVKLIQYDVQHLISIKQKISTRNIIVDDSKVVFCIQFSSVNCGKIIGDKYYYYYYNYQHVIKSGLFEVPTQFVVESIDNDAKLFELILRNFSKHMGVPSYNYNVVHAGGASSASSVMDKIVSDGKICICVLDSDKYCYLSKDEKIQRDIKKKFELENYVGDVFIIPVREVENLIPFSVVEISYQNMDANNLRKIKEIVCRDKSKQGEGFWCYFDIKEGLCGKKIVKKFSSSIEVLKWYSCKLNVPVDELEQVKIKGFGNNILSVVLSTGRSMKMYDSHLNRVFEGGEVYQLFKLVLWYSVSSKPSRV